jgi:hypothetical protein
MRNHIKIYTDRRKVSAIEQLESYKKMFRLAYRSINRSGHTKDFLPALSYPSMLVRIYKFVVVLLGSSTNRTRVSPYFSPRTVVILEGEIEEFNDNFLHFIFSLKDISRIHKHYNSTSSCNPNYLKHSSNSYVVTHKNS